MEATAFSTRWTRSRRLYAGLIVVLLFALIATVVVAPPAHAAKPPRNTPRQEIEAQYIHSLGRQRASSDTHHLNGIYSECEFGIVRATYVIANSPEAKSRWRNPMNLAGMLYQSVLARDPDPGGLRHYTRMIGTRSLAYATRDIMASPEYHHRLDRLCASQVRAGWEMSRVFAPNDARALVRDEIVYHIRKNDMSCKTVNFLSYAHSQLATRSKLIEVHYALTRAGVQFLNPFCKRMLTFTRAAKHIVERADSGYPTFIHVGYGGLNWLQERDIQIWVGYPDSYTLYRSRS